MTLREQQAAAELAARIQRRAEKADVRLIDWCEQYAWVQAGPIWKRFCLDGHEYMRELYEDPAPQEVLEKAAQMTATTYAIQRALHAVESIGLTVAYLFPTDTEVEDFSNIRIRPYLEQCEYLQAQCDNINNVHLRRIGDGWLVLRGMKEKRRVKSIPAQMIIFDELDESEPTTKQQAIERMSHAYEQGFGWWLELSTPTIPDFGIDIKWKQSDQRFWHVACGCREGIVLEDNWPDCIGIAKEGSDEQEVYLRCPKCGKDRLNPEAFATLGEYRGWIPRLPEVKDIRGHHLCQLFSTAITTAKIWAEWKDTRDIAEFHNSKLGLPYAGDRRPLTALAFGDWELATSGKDVQIGIDQGDELYLVVVKRDPNVGRLKVINAMVIVGNDPWPEAIRVCGAYKDPVIVVDAMPDKNDARKLCEAFPGRAFMCYYSDQQKDALVWDTDSDDADSGRKVTAQRTETLDRLVDDCQAPLAGRNDGMVFPHEGLPISKVIKDHLLSLARVKRKRLITTPGGRQETGEEEWVYVHSGPDHFAHALNYAKIAGSAEVYGGWAGFL